MIVRCFQVILVLIFGVSCCGYAENGPTHLEWQAIAELPDPLGVAGPFAGISNGVFIVAGGANFPEPVWETEKQWHDSIYVLLKENDENNITWRWETGFKLKKPAAYGASVTIPEGVLCIGGNSGTEVYNDVFLLKWDSENKRVQQVEMSSLPVSNCYGSAAVLGDYVYLAGGCSEVELKSATTGFWRLNISDLSHPLELVWESLPDWPGSARAFNMTVAQHNGVTDAIYVFSGRCVDADTGETQLLTDLYEFCPSIYESDCYDPISGEYHGAVSPWRRRSDLPACRMAGIAAAVGQSHIFVLGGDDGEYFGRGDILHDKHPGFSRQCLAYHTITDTWVEAGEMPAAHVTSVAVNWDGSIIIPSGEVRPRVRSPRIWSIRMQTKNAAFGLVNSITLTVYLFSMVAVGLYFTRRNKSTDDFFRGGQRLPWFAAGLSIFATMLSSITFIAVPAKAYATNWVYFLVNMTAILVTPLVVWTFLPFFRRIDATSAYEYLEKRFNLAARLFASASFIVFQIGRMAVVMYLPALVLATITPLTEYQAILIMGVLSMIYCTAGGLEAVIWTDAIQSFILLGGALVSLIIVIWNIDGGLGSLLQMASAEGKFHLVDWDWSGGSFMTTALWVVLLGGLGQSLVPYTSDQAIIQRYMAVSDKKRAARAIWTNAVAIFPATVLFFGIGTALFVFYKCHPEKLDPGFKTDAIFPLFIARELPVGLAGLVVAGIFAAAQSTISTSMNSASTSLVTDFVRRFGLLKEEKGYLLLARIVTVLLGLLGTALALLFATSDIKSLWDQFMTILGLFGGAMCGLFCLGIFTRRTHGVGALIGALMGAVILWWFQGHTRAHLLLYGTVGIAGTFVTGYLASWLMPRPKRDLTGLTIYD